MAFRKILIANRGEIASRVIKTARALGYRTVAVYSSADAGAPHVQLADQAVHIGPPAPAQSYLSIDAVVAAARATEADAIHPGYGFLSENAGFARACADAGIVFIGPTAEAIELMGSKRASKLAMIEAGVPCVPGYQGDAQDVDSLVAAGIEIGFPLMVKASAGGGGRGMRLVSSGDDLPDALRGAAAEAKNAFGSGELIVERALVRPRHVEVQVFGDTHGNVIHLGERDCSVQRRHQKVVEESPSPAVDEALRDKMGAAAVNAARACDYVGAGTVEFLLDAAGEFYFLEMNTRLQVEHPVTELVTGYDLVAWQIQVAQGEPLPVAQEQVTLSGHAIEVRLYAEDPAQDYMPQTGTVVRWQLPEGADVRVDHGVAEGFSVGAHYDAMLAKVVAHGRTRDDARRKLGAALRDLTLLGLTSNKALLIQICDDEAFAAGGATTAFLAEDFQLRDATPKLRDRAFAALAVFFEGARGVAEDDDFIGWRSGGPVWVTIKLRSGDDVAVLQVTAAERGPHGRCYVVALERDDELERTTVEVVRADAGELLVVDDGIRRRVRYAIDGDAVWTDDGDVTRCFDNITHWPARSADAAGSGKLKAPLDGTVTNVLVEQGQTVADGQLVMIVEAMKMEHRIEADVAGTVTQLLVAQGDQVKTRQLLADIAAEGEA